MRRLLLLLSLALAACSTPGGPYPSLQPRPAEAIDPRVPVPDPVLSTEPNSSVVAQLDLLVARALAGDEAFRGSAVTAERLANVAGPAQSESWIAAQQSLSAAIAARAPVTGALGDIDALGAGRIQALGGIGAADLKAIEAASARLRAIDDEEAAAIDRIQARLRG